MMPGKFNYYTFEQFLALPKFSSNEQLGKSSVSPATTPSPLMHLFDCSWE